MKRLSFRKRLSCLVVAMLSLFAVCGTGLHAEEITYYRGAMDGPPEVQTVEKDVAIVISGMGINVPGYVIIGWHEINVPIIVSTLVMENALNAMAQYHSVGSSFTPTADMNLYAIWAIDTDNNGFPDYGGSIVRPSINKELIERMISKVDFGGDDGLLRSAPVWDNGFDLPAFNDSIYYVGCMYNIEPENQIWENLIYMNPAYCFDNQPTVAKKKMNLVIEYDGVLEEGSMIGGPTFRPLTTIEITQDMVDSEYLLKDLLKDYLNDHPFMFNAIKEDGQGILRMWFEVADESDANYGKMPDVTSGTYFDKPTGGILWGGDAWGTRPGSKGNEAFLNPEGYPDSVYTIKFNIYNKPAFESNVISQKVDSENRIDLKHVSGTPLKYMMRCINDFRWRPADAPLTKAEREEIWNEGATICLREMDKTIGHQMFLKDVFYYSSEFPPDGNPSTNIYSQDFIDFTNEKWYKYDSLLLVDYYSNDFGASGAMPPISSIGYCAVNEWYYSFFGTYLPATAPATDTPAADVYYTNLRIAFAAAQSMLQLTPSYPGAVAIQAIADSSAKADWYIEYAPRKAAAIPVPGPCRGTFCLSFESKPQPGIQRQVFIPQTAGVTTNPEYGTQYVPSQDDFYFTAKYTTAQPLKVTTNRIVDGVEEELVGTPNAAGEYEYVIRRVTQNIVLTFSAGSVDNASVMDGTAIWSYDNTINIRVAKADIASIYSIAGQLVKRIELSAGDTPVPAERGVYVVTLKDGSVHKVVVK